MEVRIASMFMSVSDVLLCENVSFEKSKVAKLLSLIVWSKWKLLTLIASAAASSRGSPSAWVGSVGPAMWFGIWIFVGVDGGVALG